VPSLYYNTAVIIVIIIDLRDKNSNENNIVQANCKAKMFQDYRQF